MSRFSAVASASVLCLSRSTPDTPVTLEATSKVSNCITVACSCSSSHGSTASEVRGKRWTQACRSQSNCFHAGLSAMSSASPRKPSCVSVALTFKASSLPRKQRKPSLMSLIANCAVIAASATSGRNMSSAWMAATRCAVRRRINFSECTGRVFAAGSETRALWVPWCGLPFTASRAASTTPLRSSGRIRPRLISAVPALPTNTTHPAWATNSVGHTLRASSRTVTCACKASASASSLRNSSSSPASSFS